MSDWEEDVQMDTVDNAVTTQNNFDNSNRGGDFVRKRRNDDQQSNDNRRNFNNNDNNNFRRNRDDNQNQGGDNQNQGGFRRRNRDNNDSENNGGNGNFNKNRDNSQGNRRRRDDNQNSNQDGNQGGFRRRNNSQNNNQDGQNQGDNNSQGNFNRRRRDDNQNDSNQDGNQGGFRRRRNDDNNQDGDNQGGFRRRNNSQNNNQDGNQGRRRRDDNNQNQGQNNSEQNNNGSDGQFERRRGRRNENNDENNQDGGNNEQGGERRRRNRESNDDGAPVARVEEGADGKPKERYIPRRYNKEDDDLFENIIEGINFTKFDNIPVQVSGENLPEPIQRFSDVAKDQSIIEAVQKSGYKTLTPIQKYGISAIMANRDLMASAQTGSGKTMAFLLPIIQKLVDDPSTKNYGDKCSPECLVISPTRELAIQIYEQALKLTHKNDLKPAVVYGGANSRDQQGRLSYGANLIVATPGRLLDYLDKEIISLSKVKYFVLDEADRMIDQGFIPSVKRVISDFDLPEERHTSMFSATFPIEVQKLAQQFLKQDYIFLSVGILGGANQDVKQEMVEVTFKEKKGKLLEILKGIYNQDARILIFTEKKKMADFLAANLCDNDYKTTSIHGDRLQSQREQALSTFKKGETPILVATSVAARGLDIKGVNYVINYDLPSEIEEYIHRIGRTGRVGNFGNAISFFDPNDNAGLGPKLVKALFEAGQEVPDFLKSYDDGTSFRSKDTETDERKNNADSENITSKKENYQAAAMEEDDW